MTRRLNPIPAAFVLLFLLVVPFAGYSQSQESTTIVYDPLFWKDQLRLSTEQARRIQQINSDYYQALIDFYRTHPADKTRIRQEMEHLLTARSEDIWNTFGPKQKRRWEKLSESGFEATTSLL